MADADGPWDCPSDAEDVEMDELEAAEADGAANGTLIGLDGGAGSPVDVNPAVAAMADDPDSGDDPNGPGGDGEEGPGSGEPAQKRRKIADPLKDWDPKALSGEHARR